MTPRRARGDPSAGHHERVLAAALAVTLLLGALLVVDQRRLRTEMAAVTACEVRSEEVAVLADTRLARTASYLSPARVPDTTLAENLIGRAAETARGPVAEAARGCAQVEVRPWHPTTARRRDNVLAYLTARLASLEAVAADGTRFYGEQPGDAELRRLRDRAFPAAP